MAELDLGRAVPSVAAWPVHKLTDFMAHLSQPDRESVAVQTAVAHFAEAFDAEFVAIVVDGDLASHIGFPRGQEPVEEIVRVATDSASRTIAVPGAGACHTLRVVLDELDRWTVLLGRAVEPFAAEEIALAKGMSRVLAQRVLGLRALERERRLHELDARRVDLLERLTSIQRSISTDAPLAAVLDAITDGAARLLDDTVVGLRLLADRPDQLRMVSSYGVPASVLPDIEFMKVGEGAGGRAFSEARLVVVDSYQEEINTVGSFRAHGLLTAMAAPIVEQGEVVGSLTVGSYLPGRCFSVDEQQALVALAAQAGVALANARLMEETKRALDSVTHQAAHDPLTRLPNRSLFLDRLGHALDVARRTGELVGILFIDIDNFKFVNDTLGHDTGDRLLAAVAGRILGATRVSDTAARLGGDEFAVLVEAASDEGDAVRVAERILEALAEAIVLDDEQPLHVRASIGIAIGTPGTGAATQLLQQADVAMYRAKATGKNRYAVFREEMQLLLGQRVRLGEDLRAALVTDQLEVHYQPIVDLDAGGAIAVEALVRWRHPERGAVSPAEFIPIAEDSGLIVDLGRRVLAEACDAAKRWHSEGLDLSVSVNLSSVQLQQDPGLVATVEELLVRSGLAPRCLTLEITETLFFHDLDTTAARLAELAGLGVGLALDDFGTGYSSLSYLDRFPIDTIKVDSSFTAALSTDGDRNRLAEATVQLGALLGLRTIAEGVETAEQASRLRSLGCTLAQGFHFAPAVPARDIPALLGALSARIGTEPAPR